MSAAVRPGRAVALVLNWKRSEDTMRVVGELLQCGYPDLMVHCVDNASGDGSAERLAALVGEKVSFAANEANLGFGAGMNGGIRQAEALGAEFVLVCNNDLSVHPGFLDSLVEVLQTCPEVAAVGPACLLPDGRVWAEGGLFTWGPNGSRLRRHGEAPAGGAAGPEQVDFVPGACLLCRTSELLEVGGFAEDYFMYWEDVDLCVRLRQRAEQAGRPGRSVVLPWVQVRHDAGSSGGGLKSPVRKYLQAAAAVRFLKRHGTLKGWSGWLLWDVLLWPVALGVGCARGWPGIQGALAKLRGTWAGVQGKTTGPADVARWLPKP